MNLEELKTAWSAYDRQLKASQRLQEEMITRVITERSSTRFSGVRSGYRLGIAWMVICLSGGVTILMTNPFDYYFVMQYVPIGIFSLTMLILTVGMLNGYQRLTSITVEKETVEVSLKQIIQEYERPRKLMLYTLITLLFSTVILFPLSFLPAAIQKLGLAMALAERLIPIGISALLLFIAYKLGAFRERDAPGFKNDLSELEQLKQLSNELTAE